MKKDDEYCRVIGILEKIDGLKVHRVSGGRGLKFPIYLSEKMNNTDIDTLELSVRASNCLKRAGIHTIGDLCEGLYLL